MPHRHRAQAVPLSLSPLSPACDPNYSTPSAMAQPIDITISPEVSRRPGGLEGDLRRLGSRWRHRPRRCRTWPGRRDVFTSAIPAGVVCWSWSAGATWWSYGGRGNGPRTPPDQIVRRQDARTNTASWCRIGSPAEELESRADSRPAILTPQKASGRRHDGNQSSRLVRLLGTMTEEIFLKNRARSLRSNRRAVRQMDAPPRAWRFSWERWSVFGYH